MKKIIIINFLLSLLILSSAQSDELATTIKEGLSAVNQTGSLPQSCPCLSDPTHCSLIDGQRIDLSANGIDRCQSYRFYYDQSSTCGGYGGEMLGFLSMAGRLYNDEELALRSRSFPENYRPTKEIKISAGDILRVEPNPDRQNRQTKVDIFIPILNFKCVPVGPDQCNSSNRIYAQFVNGSMNDKRAAFPQYPCGGEIFYYLPKAEPIVESWKGAASTYHDRCTVAAARFTSGMQQVKNGEAIHPMGICLNFLTESDTPKHSRNSRKDPSNPAELDFCFKNGGIANEKECVGSPPPPGPKVEITPTPTPSPIPPPEIREDKEKISEETCCGNGYAGQMLCTNYQIKGYTNYSFHIVECTGTGTWGKTIVRQLCGEPAHECCFVEKYKDWSFAQKCIDILLKK